MQHRHAAYLSPRAQPEPPEANPNMDNPFIGMIALFPYSFAPQDWLDCDGRLLPVNQYQALFSLLNTTYGGDGRSNFALPDLRGRMPIGIGTGPLGRYDLGKTQGQNSTSISSTPLIIPAARADDPKPTVVVVNTAKDPINVQNPSLALRWCIFVGSGEYPTRD